MQAPQKNPLFREDFSRCCSLSISRNSVSFDYSKYDSNLSRPEITRGLKRFSTTEVEARSCTKVRILAVFTPTKGFRHCFAPRGHPRRELPATIPL
jgi:hypothetical protein